VKLQREIAEHERQIAANQKERDEKLEALEQLKDHAPAPAAAKKEEK
jgi:hypothetical protein